MSRRCLICANINPCALHTDDEQSRELARNMRLAPDDEDAEWLWAFIRRAVLHVDEIAPLERIATRLSNGDGLRELLACARGFIPGDADGPRHLRAQIDAALSAESATQQENAK